MCNASSTNVSTVTRYLAWLSILIVVVLSSAALAGSILDIPLLEGIKAEWEPMSRITAISLIISAIGTALILMEEDHKKSFMIFVPGIAVLVVGLLAGGVYVLAMLETQGVSHTPMLIREYFNDPCTRVALVTALIFIVSGSVLVLLSTGKPHLSEIAHTLMVPVALVSYIIPVSYLLDVQIMHEWFGIPVALNTGIAFCALCVALCCANPTPGS